MKKLYKVLAVGVVASVFAGCGGNSPTVVSQTTNYGSMSGASFKGKTGELGNAKPTNQIGNTRSSVNSRAELKDYVQNEGNAKLNGGSYLRFNPDGSVNLEIELCVTTEDNCRRMRQYADDDDEVKTSAGDTTGKSVREHYYTRRSVKFTNTQKVSDADARADFDVLVDYLDFYRVSSEDMGAGRSKFSGAKLEDPLASEDHLHDSTSSKYWRAGQNRTLTLAISKKGVLSSYARLGFWAYATGGKTRIALSTIGGEYTKAERLSQVGASYSKAQGWYAFGMYNDRSHLFFGDVEIEFDVANKRLTKFDVSNMYRHEMDRNFKPVKNRRASYLISEDAKLQLQGGTSRSYNNRGFYDATLTESGGVTGQAGEWQASLRGHSLGQMPTKPPVLWWLRKMPIQMAVIQPVKIMRLADLLLQNSKNQYIFSLHSPPLWGDFFIYIKTYMYFVVKYICT